MKCIIVDDEPIARRGIEKMAAGFPELKVSGTFGSAEMAAIFLMDNTIDLIFLDIQMPGTSGIDFARSIPRTTLVIFTTAFPQFAADSYEVDAVDYLVKPIRPERFRKAVEKAAAYHALLLSEEKANRIEQVEADFIFIKSDRRFFKVNFRDILFIEGLKDYVILQTTTQKLITHLNLKAIHELLPPQKFLRTNRSYIINKDHLHSFTPHDAYIGPHEIAISDSYRDSFLEGVMGR